MFVYHLFKVMFISKMKKIGFKGPAWSNKCCQARRTKGK